MPCLLVEEEEIQEVAERQPARHLSSKSGAVNCWVVVRAGPILVRLRKRTTPSFLEHAPVDLGEADLQQHLLALAAARHLQQVDHRRAWRPTAWAISPARSMTFVLETWPDRIVESSLVLTWMSSPGNSICRFCCSVVTGCSTTRSYCAPVGRPQTIRLIVPGGLAVDQDLARLHHRRVGDAGLVIAIREMLKSVASTVERPAVSDTFGYSAARRRLRRRWRRHRRLRRAPGAAPDRGLRVGGDAGGREQSGTRQRRELTVDGLCSGLSLLHDLFAALGGPNGLDAVDLRGLGGRHHRRLRRDDARLTVLRLSRPADRPGRPSGWPSGRPWCRSERRPADCAAPA